MMMTRRTLSAALVAGAAASLISTRGMAADSPPTQARNVVLVHGLFADGSCWSEMIARLQLAGLNVTAVQNPLTTLPEAVASNRRQRPASFSTAMKDVSPRKRSCATSRATCRRRRCSMRSRSRSIRLCSPARPRTRHGDPSPAITPFLRKTAPSIRTSSASWPNGWAPRPSR